MTTSGIMRMPLLALLPGTVAYTWLYGAGVIINLIVAITVAAATEAIILRMRQLPILSLGDGTVMVSAVLLGLCLPPLLPLWQVAVGIVFAVVFGKHVYGGMGQNVFNPAMVGFAVLIVSFPLSMSQWPEPEFRLSLTDTLSAKVTMMDGRAAYDGVTAATPLDAYKFRTGTTNTEFFDSLQSANWFNWMVINLCFLAGGLYLLYRRIISWQAPAGMLGCLVLLALIFYDSGSSASLGSPGFHLLSGATMLAAFFVVTDPVTAPSDSRGLLLYGFGIGVFTFVIRTIGAYPEGIAFAVLLMNACSPMIDHVFSAREQLHEDN